MCRPHDIVVSDSKAASLLVSLQEDVVENNIQDQGTEFLAADLILNYGFDGSSRQSNYIQRYSGGQSSGSDSSIFATTVTALQLLDASNKYIMEQSDSPIHSFFEVGIYKREQGLHLTGRQEFERANMQINTLKDCFTKRKDW